MSADVLEMLFLNDDKLLMHDEEYDCAVHESLKRPLTFLLIHKVYPAVLLREPVESDERRSEPLATQQSIRKNRGRRGLRELNGCAREARPGGAEKSETKHERDKRAMKNVQIPPPTPPLM